MKRIVAVSTLITVLLLASGVLPTFITADLTQVFEALRANDGVVGIETAPRGGAGGCDVMVTTKKGSFVPQLFGSTYMPTLSDSTTDVWYFSSDWPCPPPTSSFGANPPKNFWRLWAIAGFSIVALFLLKRFMLKRKTSFA